MNEISVIQVSKFPNAQKFEIELNDVIPNAILYFECKVPMDRDGAINLLPKIIGSLKNIEICEKHAKPIEEIEQHG